MCMLIYIHRCLTNNTNTHITAMYTHTYAGPGHKYTHKDYNIKCASTHQNDEYIHAQLSTCILYIYKPT